jgi:hypothetical protein
LSRAVFLKQVFSNPIFNMGNTSSSNAVNFVYNCSFDIETAQAQPVIQMAGSSSLYIGVLNFTLLSSNVPVGINFIGQQTIPHVLGQVAFTSYSPLAYLGSGTNVMLFNSLIGTSAVSTITTASSNAVAPVLYYANNCTSPGGNSVIHSSIVKTPMVSFPQ